MRQSSVRKGHLHQQHIADAGRAIAALEHEIADLNAPRVGPSSFRCGQRAQG
jgi:hypothetical protein